MKYSLSSDKGRCSRQFQDDYDDIADGDGDGDDNLYCIPELEN